MQALSATKLSRSFAVVPSVFPFENELQVLNAKAELGGGQARIDAQVLLIYIYIATGVFTLCGCSTRLGYLLTYLLMLAHFSISISIYVNV